MRAWLKELSNSLRTRLRYDGMELDWLGEFEKVLFDATGSSGVGPAHTVARVTLTNQRLVVKRPPYGQNYLKIEDPVHEIPIGRLKLTSVRTFSVPFVGAGGRYEVTVSDCCGHECRFWLFDPVDVRDLTRLLT